MHYNSNQNMSMDTHNDQNSMLDIVMNNDNGMSFNQGDNNNPGLVQNVSPSMLQQQSPPNMIHSMPMHMHHQLPPPQGLGLIPILNPAMGSHMLPPPQNAPNQQFNPQMQQRFPMRGG